MVLSFFRPQQLVCTINAPVIECLKNVTGFSYVPPSGLTVSSAQWTFGDGSSSNSVSPKYVFKNIGFYTVRVRITFTNSTTALDSHLIQVVGLPKAIYFYAAGTDTCSGQKQLCLKDSSIEAKNGQDIVKRLIVWGDGNFSQSNAPLKGDITCHKYAKADKYLIKMEITDTHGCKSSQLSNISIVEQTDANFNSTSQFKDCKTKEFCLINASKGVNAGTASYRWYVNDTLIDTSANLSSYKCISYTSGRFVTAKLVVRDKSGCIDSISKAYYVLIDALPKKIRIRDSVACYNPVNPNLASIDPCQNDNIIWKIDNTIINPKGFDVQPIDGKSVGVLPGMHTVYCQIIRGNCTTTLSIPYRILGPVGAIKVLDDNNCFSSRKVFFVDDSRFVDRSRAVFKWIIYDNTADTCTIYRAKNINTYTNCIYSRDWYTKHTYKDFKSPHNVLFTIKDTVNGCMDDVRYTIQPKICSPLLSYKSLSFCEGDVFTKNPSASDPKFISLDSGKTWKKFPMTLSPPLAGKYDVGFIFETISTEWGQNIGNDSLRIRKDTMRFYDTIFKPAYLNIYPYKNDVVSFKFYGKCSPYSLSVHFQQGMFYPGEKLEISWDDGTKHTETFTDTIHIDSIFHTYTTPGFNYNVRVAAANANGCESDDYFVKKAGHTIGVHQLERYYCNGDTPICFTPRVYDAASKTYWKGNGNGNHVSWRFEDSGSEVQQFKTCHSFTKKGFQHYRMIVNDSLGCSDTLRDSIFIQDLRANVRNTSKEIYCSELKQFFDSSSMLPYKIDSITSYVWDFGTGTFTNPQKNPFKSLNISAESVPVTHAVKTLNGCVDTLRFDLKIHGSHPYFKISDTIGCDSLFTIFTNLSKNCSGYIWEYGDPDHTSFATDNKQPTQFDYLRPGRYHIRLYGYDSIYNPATKAVYFCNNVFPDPVYQKDSIRSVLVLPSAKTGIISPDTICVGSQFYLTSSSDSACVYDHWKTGDDSSYTSNVRDTVYHRYFQAGKYTVHLKPSYLNPAYNICSDSASKIITVLGVDADFNIDPVSKAPLYKFINKSKPAFALLSWNFGQPSAGSRNYSSEQQPYHHYGMDTGQYTICLVAKIPFGCADTTCQNIFNDYMPGFLIPNVFTPANVDDKNDYYDIIIEGESSYRLRIYDRWGVLVFEGTEDGDNLNQVNWNGRLMNKGTECPSGTYYYIFDYHLKTNPDKKETINGTVTLIR